MVNPLYLNVLFLIAAFMSALVDKLSRKLSISLLYLTAVTALGLSVWQLFSLLNGYPGEAQVFGAGFTAPLSIALQFGLEEAVLLSLINFMGIWGGLYLYKRFAEFGAQPIALYLLMLLGANGLVLTRDIFNAFVFLEILSIATYAMIGVKQSKNALAAGIKYMFAGGISSAILLIGIIFVYRYTGTLNLDQWIGLNYMGGKAYHAAIFLLAISIFIELKPFPANGWALDFYQSVDSGLSAVVSSINTAAVLFLFHKLMPLFSYSMLYLFAGAGLVSFIMANLLAIRQSDARRLLGYSSTAQTGLLVFVLSALTIFNLPTGLRLVIALGLFLTNFLAKSGLFWLAGLIKERDIKLWGALRTDYGLVIAFGIFVLALMGFPPFPAFFAKWELVQFFVQGKAWIWLGGLLLGSLFEVVYLIRWFGYVCKGDALSYLRRPVTRVIPVLASAITLGVTSYFLNKSYPGLMNFSVYPVLALLLFGLVDFLPAKVKGMLAIAVLGIWTWFFMLPSLPLPGQLFILVLVVGSIVQIFAFMHRKGAAEGYFPFLTMLIFSLGNVVLATSALEFFIAWELMTISSYLLILKGKKAERAAGIYAIFSTFGAYLILVGLSMVPQLFPSYPIILQANYVSIGKLTALLMGAGFLIKMGAFGVHYWLPDAYAEADDETSSLLSSVLSKAGVYGLLIVLIMLSGAVTSTSYSMIALGWLGVLTAFFGALMAVFQEDIKKLLAYSSMSQLGYIVLGFSLMSHLGWVSALYLTLNHMLFKGLIFIAIAAVILRTKTRMMYEMGGLIKKMPIAFISVLIGIITVSGVPPLSGFGSKWFIYTSLLEQGRYLQTGLAFFSSAIAFLYLYRLIHTVFLGQAKPEHREVKEAPIWLIIPQVIFMMAIMAVSFLPNLITKPLSSIVAYTFVRPEWMSWNGYNIVLDSPLIKGIWNGNLVMLVTMGVFIFPLIWLLLVNARVQKVKQFNIVFAAERPFKPGTTHYAYNMFAPYQKALGSLVKPRATAFYEGVAEWTRAISATISRLYTGNGQTYMLHIFLYIIAMYFLMGVK
jgi:formate hydrogenlyase subunit 3/multisubunit Na+/H+ antiporter MnhD subunit